MTHKQIEGILKGAKTNRQVLDRLRKAGVRFKDDSKLYEYFNVHVPHGDGTVTRVFRHPRVGIKVQLLTPVEIKWSGIPVFEPSGRHSF